VSDSPLTLALRQFESAEANLVKLETLWDEISSLIPEGISFGENVEYENRSRAFVSVLEALPKIDGWRPSESPADLDTIAQWRFDAKECGDITAEVTIEREIEAPSRAIREYRFKLNQKRRALIREAVVALVDSVDDDLRSIRALVKGLQPHASAAGQSWTSLRSRIDEIDALLGSSVQRPERWNDLRRHLHFGMVGDLNDIEKWDWPSVKKGLRQGLYGAHDPIPVGVADLSELVAAKPSGPVSTKLKWSNIDDEDFERLMFSLIGSVASYENPEWLTKTNAPDRGRDLSVTRVSVDPLSGTTRSRVIIQCRHRQNSSVSVSDVATLKLQMSSWGDPRVDVLTIATTGRFSADAVAAIEKQNLSDTSLKIEMWPDSHLERLLASRPAIIAEFGLR
jgi:restriction endonuclease